MRNEDNYNVGDSDNLNRSENQLDYSTQTNNSEPSIPEGEGRDGSIYTTPDGRNGYVRYSNDSKAKKSKVALPIAVIAVVLVLVIASVVMFCITMGGLKYVNRLFSGMNTNRNDDYETENKVNAITATEKVTEASEPFVPIEKKQSISMANTESEGIRTSAGIVGSPLPTVIAEIKDTVVVITTESTAYNVWYGQYVTSGAGSGVIIRESGEIVTNYHVVDGANEISVTTTDGTSYKATLKAYDAASDIALLKITPNGTLKAAKLGCSADIVVGEEVIAIGNPLGTLGGTVTKGIISATARLVKIGENVMTLLQTDAAVSPGNSGGGLFNVAGELIGIVNAKSTGNNAEGLSFAIPVDYAYTVVSQLEEFGYVKGKVDAGLDLYEADRNVAFYKFGSYNAGLFVLESRYSDEIKPGDRVLSVNGAGITSQFDYNNIMSQFKVGDVITVEVERIVVNKNRGTATTYQVKLELHENIPKNVK